MKLTSFRRKDQVHIQDMIGVGLIDATWPIHGRGARRSIAGNSCNTGKDDRLGITRFSGGVSFDGVAEFARIRVSPHPEFWRIRLHHQRIWLHPIGCDYSKEIDGND